jgi:hypothetical protein
MNDHIAIWGTPAGAWILTDEDRLPDLLAGETARLRGFVPLFHFKRSLNCCGSIDYAILAENLQRVN